MLEAARAEQWQHERETKEWAAHRALLSLPFSLCPCIRKGHWGLSVGGTPTSPVCSGTVVWL